MRLNEFTPSRTQFSRILVDTTIHMGFECEVMLPEESDDDDGDFEIDYDAEHDRINEMDWSEISGYMSRRAISRVNEAYQEWLSEKISKEWQDVADNEVHRYCIDHDLIKGDSQKQHKFPWPDWLALGNATTVRAYAERHFPDMVQPLMVLWNGIHMERSANGRDDDLQAIIKRVEGFGNLSMWDTNIDEITKAATELFKVPEPEEEKTYDSEEDVLADDDNIQAAKEEWEENEDFASQYDMDEFIDDTYRNMSAFCSDFDIDIEPDESNYQRSSSDSSVEEVHRNAASDLEDELDGATILIGRGGSQDWHVEQDSSLSGSGTGMEIVSPVFGMTEGLDALKKVFAWIEQSASTNASTGLHVSFSIDGKTENDYDYLKMIMLFDENYTAQLFKRLSNQYASQMRTNVFSSLNNITEIGKLSERSMSEMVAHLRGLSQQVHNISSKYFSFRHRAKGVFEFRTMGNKGYEQRYDVIRKRIVAMAAVMKVGSDPTMMVREYLTRIFKMLTSEKFSSSTTVIKTPQPPAMLSAFAKIWTPQLIQQAVKDPRNFLPALMSQNVTLDRAQILQLRLYAIKRGLRPDMFDDYRRTHLPLYNRLANYLRWPLIVPSDPGQSTFSFARPGTMNSETPNDEPVTRLPMTA